MTDITLYGIKNCDSVKKARKWLDDHSVPYEFHDFRIDGITKTLVNDFLKDNAVDVVINKRGTTWRKLAEAQKQVTTKTQAIELMLDNPTIIKRPVLLVNGAYSVGFSEEKYESLGL